MSTARLTKPVKRLADDSPRRQRERDIAERVFAEAVREIIAVNPDLGKEDLFPRLCGRFHLDDETWGQYQAIGRRS